MSESLYKLEKKIATAVMTIKLERDTHVPDLMTRIRILPGIAIVAQKDKVARFMDGDAMLPVSIKYLPATTEIYVGVEKIAKMIKRLPGVKTVSVSEFNKKTITLHGKRIIF